MSIEIARSGDEGRPFASEKKGGESEVLDAITDRVIDLVESRS
jgi:hypothetical protein